MRRDVRKRGAERGEWVPTPSSSRFVAVSSIHAMLAALNVGPGALVSSPCLAARSKATPEPAHAEAGIPLSRQITCHFDVGAVSTRLASRGN